MKKIIAVCIAVLLLTVLVSCGMKENNGTTAENKNGVVGSAASNISTDLSSAVSEMSSDMSSTDIIGSDTSTSVTDDNATTKG
jgi:hypothetical protein